MRKNEQKAVVSNFCNGMAWKRYIMWNIGNLNHQADWIWSIVNIAIPGFQ